MFHHRGDMMFELACEIYRGDAAAAEAKLAEMRAIGIFSDVIMRAREVVRPLPPAQPLREGMPLPIEGHLPGSMMGRPVTVSKARA